MLELFNQGGLLFMGLLTIILVIMVSMSIINGMPVFKNKLGDPEGITKKIGYIRSVGVFALIIGLLGQLIGLFSAFRAIELGAVDVSPVVVASGFKVSMITTIYGIIIYALSLLIWFGLNMKLDKKLN